MMPANLFKLAILFLGFIGYLTGTKQSSRELRSIAHNHRDRRSIYLNSKAPILIAAFITIPISVALPALRGRSARSQTEYNATEVPYSYDDPLYSAQLFLYHQFTIRKLHWSFWCRFGMICVDNVSSVKSPHRRTPILRCMAFSKSSSQRIWRWRSHISVVSSAITMRWLKERNQLFNTLRIQLPFAISFSVNAQMTLRKRSTWMCCTSCSSWRKNSALNSPTPRPNFWNSFYHVYFVDKDVTWGSFHEQK